MSSVETYEQAEAFLYGRVNFERAHAAGATSGDFKLDRMRELLRRLGDPHLALPSLHIAGTKGKGSTAVMCASVLQAAGYRTGLFTSPHIARFEERMTVDGVLPSPDEVVSLVKRVRAVATEMDSEPTPSSPTFFEVVTAMGWLHFLDAGVDIVVLEVGLGGRLDSTNLCRPEVCVITSISRDHTNLLGSTLAEIAAEKAGIIKTGVPVISGAETDDARRSIREIASRKNAPLYELRHEIQFTVHEPPIEINAVPRRLPASDLHPPSDSTSTDAPPDSGGGIIRRTIDVATPRKQHKKLPVSLRGSHQGINAALAVSAIDALASRGWNVSSEALEAGLRDVSWPLRIEVVRNNPTVILDAAHNWASIKALVSTLDEDFLGRRRVLIFGGTKDKDVAGLLRQLLPRFDSIILTQYQHNPRGVPVDQLAQMVRHLCDIPFHQTQGPREAFALAEKLAGPDDLICVTGSFFLAAEMRDFLVRVPATTVEQQEQHPPILDSVQTG